MLLQVQLNSVTPRWKTGKLEISDELQSQIYAHINIARRLEKRTLMRSREIENPEYL